MSYVVTQTFDTVPKKVRDKAVEKGMTISEQQTLVIDDEKTLLSVLGRLKAHQDAGNDVGFDTEATSQRAATAALIGLSFAADHKRGFYIPVGHVTDELQLPIDLVLDAVSDVLGGPGLVMANGKFDWQLMRRHGVTVAYGKDNQVYSRLMGDIEWGVGLKPTMARVFNEACVEYNDLVSKKAPTLAHVEIGEVGKYAGADAINVLRCVHKLADQLPSEVRKMLLAVEHEVLRIAGDMEYNGAPVDKEFVLRHIAEGEAMSALLKTETITKLKEIAVKNGSDPALVPDDLNLDSAPQMQKIIYDVCKFPIIKRSKKTKKPSADKATISILAEKHKEIEWVSRWRSATTRVNDLKELIEFGLETDGWWYVHGGLNPQRAATGRWGSSAPNLQNMTKELSIYEGDTARWEVKLRDALLAPPGYFIVTADYSQVELRVAAGESGCRAWVDAFANNIDVHVATAAAAYKIPIEAVTPVQRQRGKTLNFSMLFGATEDNIAMQLGITVEAAKTLVDAFWSGLPEVTAWKNNIHAFAKSQGYAATHFGRRRYFPVFIDPPTDSRARRWQTLEALRESLNTVVQGTAADILKIGLVRAEKTWDRFGAKPWLTIHDQYVWIVPESANPQEFCSAIDERISFPIPGYPEIVSDFSIGRRFGSLVEFKGGASQVPQSWEEVFSGQKGLAEGKVADKELRIEVERFADPTKLIALLTENPGAHAVRIVSASPAIDMVLERKTSLTDDDALKIQAAVPRAKVSFAA